MKQEREKSDNARLELFYTLQAIEHLATIDYCLIQLESQSNLNLLDATCALQKERKRLVDTKEAYFKADKTLQNLHEMGFRHKNDQSFIEDVLINWGEKNAPES